jgi:hypothetical protein
MAQLHEYDPNAQPVSFEVLPAGEYEAVIIESDEKENKGKTGRMISLTWQIISGPHEGRQVWQNINYRHDNPKAQQIGQGEFASVRKAVGVNAPRDTAELHDRPCRIVLKVKPAEGNYKEGNEVSAVKPMADSTSTAAAASPPPQQAPAPATPAPAPAPAPTAGKKFPWRK